MIRLILALAVIMALCSCRQYRRCELYYKADNQLRSTFYYRAYSGEDVKEWGYKVENGYLYVNRNCGGKNDPYLLADSAVTNTWEMCEKHTTEKCVCDE